MRVPNLQGGRNEIKAVRSSSKSSLQVVSRPPASRVLKDKHKRGADTLDCAVEIIVASYLRPLPDLQHRQSLGLQIVDTQGLGFVTPWTPYEEARDILFRYSGASFLFAS
jgi:hypothetical protein